MRTRATVAVMLVALGAGCAADDPLPPTSVAVELKEWSVTADPSLVRVSAVVDQPLEFVATNTGQETHELVIVRADSPADLPTDADGKVVEDALPEGAFIGEIPEFDAGTTESATFELEPGRYVLFCNILEINDGEPESHFQQGMVTTFTVTS
ncbi:MAG: hypothetical protein D6683_00245 [Actinomyces sp.]|nr:MAG: hypothetical protein D6683_00245 [Actinomyces sp.]